MLSAVIHSAHGYPAFTPGGITGTPEVRPSQSSRTKESFSQYSNAYTGYGPNCFTTFWTQLTYHFNGRTARPLERTTALGYDKPTSRCQTFPSMWTLGEDQPVHYVIVRNWVPSPEGSKRSRRDGSLYPRGKSPWPHFDRLTSFGFPKVQTMSSTFFPWRRQFICHWRNNMRFYPFHKILEIELRKSEVLEKKIKLSGTRGKIIGHKTSLSSRWTFSLTLLFCFQELRCKLAYVERGYKDLDRSAHLAVFALHPIYCLGITNKRDNILSLE